MESETCPVSTEADLARVRAVLRQAARKAGLGAVAEARLMTACTELARNILHHAGKGWCRVQTGGGECGEVRVVFADDGPGIPDLAAAMTDGFSTRNTLGLGLPGSRRLVDKFDITSGPDGTAVTVAVWNR